MAEAQYETHIILKLSEDEAAALASRLSDPVGSDDDNSSVLAALELIGY